MPLPSYSRSEIVYPDSSSPILNTWSRKLKKIGKFLLRYIDLGESHGVAGVRFFNIKFFIFIQGVSY